MFRSFMTCFVAIGCLGSFALTHAAAQSVAYKSSGDGHYSPITGDYGGTGVATHLGKLTFSGIVFITPTAHPLVFDFSIPSENPQETVGVNGDKIFFSGSGQVALIPLDPAFTVFSAVWSGHFIIEGGTGRFANAGPGPQPLAVEAINDPFTLADPEWSFGWTVNGRIRLK